MKKKTKNPLKNYQVHEYILIAKYYFRESNLRYSAENYLTHELKKLLAEPVKIGTYKKIVLNADPDFFEKWKSQNNTYSSIEACERAQEHLSRPEYKEKKALDLARNVREYQKENEISCHEETYHFLIIIDKNKTKLNIAKLYLYKLLNRAGFVKYFESKIKQAQDDFDDDEYYSDEYYFPDIVKKYKIPEEYVFISEEMIKERTKNKSKNYIEKIIKNLDKIAI